VIISFCFHGFAGTTLCKEASSIALDAHAVQARVRLSTGADVRTVAAEAERLHVRHCLEFARLNRLRGAVDLGGPWLHRVELHKALHQLIRG